jgi:allantoin racemase
VRNAISNLQFAIRNFPMEVAMHIRVIVPILDNAWGDDRGQMYRAAARAGTEVSIASIDWGPASIETYRDEALAIPEVLGKIVEAEREEVDAVILNCMADPGLFAARELVSIPVVGPAQATMHLAAMLGHRFSVVTIFDQDVPSVEDLVARYGLSGRLASVRGINIPVLDLHDNLEITLQAVVAAAERAVREDGAHVIVPGCTGLGGLAPRVQASLAERGCPVPVLDPPSVAVKMAEMLVDLGQSHSKRTWPTPPTKKIRWPVPGAFGQAQE